MSLGDLRRLISRATPRIEDVRAPDRMDIIRREHGHLTLREIVDALDALEFSATAFVELMREHLASAEGEQKVTAVDGLFNAMSGLQFLSASFAEQAAPEVAKAGDEEAEGEGQPEEAAAAKQRGAECFKQKDFAKATEEYTAAIRATARGGEGLHLLYSNRSAARLQLADTSIEVAWAALMDARRCVELAPEWPKGHFREGAAWRQLGFAAQSTAAFRAGQKLEPENKDWPKEVEKTEQPRRAKPPALSWQLLFNLLPELLGAWACGGVARGMSGGVLQVQANGTFEELGSAKWQQLRDTKAATKAQLRYAFLDRKDYLANLAANLQSAPEGVAVVDVDGQPLKIAELASFLPKEGSDLAAIHIDVKGSAGGKMLAVLCLVPCGEQLRQFLPLQKDPPPPKGPVDGVLSVQRASGFPKAYPRLLGFHSIPGTLNFPVVDLERDAPGLKGQ